VPRSLKIHPSHKPTILQALTRNGFLTQGALAGHLDMALSTVSNFINSRPVYLSNVEIICEALGLDPAELIHPIAEATETSQEASDTSTALSLSFSSYDAAWVGREETVRRLSQLLQQSKRLLLILGLTGIGKTALAERLILENQSQVKQFQRVNLEGMPSTDFASIALQWLQGWEVPLSTQDYEPEQLLHHLLQYLQEHQVLLFFDSLEVLLVPDENSYGGQFQDPYWSAFFQGFLAAPESLSRILITSQELPEQVVQQRYHRLWESHLLTGLTEAEQLDLLVATGLNFETSTPEFNILHRLGKVYRGHPLVLRVIIGEIWETFHGNVLAYWQEVQGKIEEVEQAIEKAETDAHQAIGADDQWKLHKLTLQVRLEVNKQRLKSVFQRLEQQAPDAYWLLCSAAVYRIPVQVEGWLMQLGNLVLGVEKKVCDRERQEQALAELSQRFLLEESINLDHQRLLGQHPLIRSLALEHYQQLIQQLQERVESA